MTTNIIIDAEFKALIPALAVEERKQLEANLIAEGCRDALVVWSGHGILLDGHNRFEICQQHNIHFETNELLLPDRDAVRSWIINNQFGRRNLSPDQLSYFRGKQYHSQKLNKLDNLCKDESILLKGHNDPSGNTAKFLADQHKVSPETIKRDARYAMAVDSIGLNCGEQIKATLLNRETRMTKKEIIGLARTSPQFQRTVIAKVISGDARSFRAAKRQVKRERTESQVEANREQIVEGWFHGDWREHIGKLTDGSISLLLTDPPCDKDNQDNQTASNATQERTFHEFVDFLKEFYPKFSADAHLLVFCTWDHEPSLRASINVSGYTVRNVLVWVKNDQVSGNLDGTFTPKHELIIHSVKGNPLMIKPMGDVIVAVRSSSGIHQNEKPMKLLKRLLEATTVEGALVADPFGGVASTCIAAYLSARRYWSCEIDEGSYVTGLTRLKSEL